MTITEADKIRLLDFIKQCRQKGFDPQQEATKRFLEVRDMLEVNTPAYRRAYSIPTAFYVLNTADEAVFKIINVMD